MIHGTRYPKLGGFFFPLICLVSLAYLQGMELSSSDEGPFDEDFFSAKDTSGEESGAESDWAVALYDSSIMQPKLKREPVNDCFFCKKATKIDGDDSSLGATIQIPMYVYQEVQRKWRRIKSILVFSINVATMLLPTDQGYFSRTLTGVASASPLLVNTDMVTVYTDINQDQKKPLPKTVSNVLCDLMIAKNSEGSSNLFLSEYLTHCLAGGLCGFTLKTIYLCFKKGAA
jgi:hypothetical protein